MKVKRLIAVSIAVALAFILNGSELLGQKSETTITAKFADSVGLYVGNDVVVLGYPVGEVTNIEPHGTYVLVELSVDSDVKIPADAGAVIVPPSVVTDRYVEITPAYDGGETMPSGGEIPLERTRTPVEFDRLLAAVDKFARGLTRTERKTGAIDDVLSVGARVLDGNGRRLKRTIEGLSSAVDVAARNRDDVAGLIANLDSLLKAAADSDATIESFSHNLTEVTSSFAEEGPALDAAFRAWSTSLTEVARFVRSNHKLARKDITGLLTTTETLLAHQRELQEAIDVFPLAFQNLGAAIDVQEGRGRLHLIDESVTAPMFPATLCERFDIGPLCDLLLGGLQ